MKQVILTPMIIFVTSLTTKCDVNLPKNETIVSQDSIQTNNIQIDEETAFFMKNKKRTKRTYENKHAIKTEIKAVNAVCLVNFNRQTTF